MMVCMIMHGFRGAVSRSALVLDSRYLLLHHAGERVGWITAWYSVIQPRKGTNGSWNMKQFVAQDMIWHKRKWDANKSTLYVTVTP